MPEEILVEFASRPHRLSAVWFADIVGYTRLSSENQVTALWLVRLLQSTAEAVAKADGGRVVKRIGDAVLAEFSSTHGAVLAAATLHQIFDQQTRHSGAAATLRIGVHAADVVVDDDGDIYGDGVNLAARLQAAAEPGAIVSSEDVWRQLRGRPEFTFKPLGERQLDAAGLRMEIYAVILTPSATLSPGSGPAAGEPRILPSFCGETSPTCPYMGLKAFSEADAPLYFGREAFSRQLFEKIHQHRLVSLVSASGSGKSSLLQAGLLPLLRSEISGEGRWAAVVFTPGPRPFHSLAAALVEHWAPGGTAADLLREAEQLGSDCAIGKVALVSAMRLALDHLQQRKIERLLLVVDQFEELFTQTRDDGVRLSFVEQLIETAELGPVRVVLTLRADFYGQAIGLSRNLSDRVQNGLVNVGPMSRDELTRAIVEPAAVAGLQFERGLVDRILDDVKQQAGALPLLQFALTELWNRRQGRLLTHAAYEEIGRVEGAIGRRADQVIAQWRPDEQERLIRELTRLVRVTAAHEEGSDTRVRARVSDLPTEVQAMVRSFVDARLLVADRDMVTGDDTVEVAHEALIRSWPRLRNALDRDRSFLLWRQRLRQRIEEWEELGGSTDLLLMGPLLTDARRWTRRRAPELNDREREFIKASSRRANRRRRVGVGAGAAALLGLAGLGSLQAYSFTDHYLASRAISDGRNLIATATDSTAIAWFAAVIEAGDLAIALEGARTIPEIPQRSIALSRIAKILAQSGDSLGADRVRNEAGAMAIAEVEEARSILEPERRAAAIARSLPALSEAGRHTESLAFSDEALRSAQAIPSATRRANFLITLAGQLISAGHPSLALQALVVSGGSETIATQTVRAGYLVQSGAVREGLAIVASADPALRREMMDHILVSLDEADPQLIGPDGAQEILAAISHQPGFDSAFRLSMATPTLIKAGSAEQVIHAAEAIADSATRTAALGAIVPDLAAAGYLDEALRILSDLPTGERDYARGLASIAVQHAKRGESAEALSQVAGVVHSAESESDPYMAGVLFSHVTETLSLIGRREEALQMAQRADSAALLDPYRQVRSGLTVGIAKQYAVLGSLREARRLAEREYVQNGGRLSVFATMISAYARKKDGRTSLGQGGRSTVSRTQYSTG